MEEEFASEIQQQPSYQNLDLVWAKIQGWPWWPAKISQIPSTNNGKYRVQFLGDTSHSFLPQEKLIGYAQGRDRHSNPKGHFRSFAKALALADKLFQSAPVRKDEAKTDCTSGEKLPIQQIQIINQSQQVPSYSKADQEQKQYNFQHSQQSQPSAKNAARPRDRVKERERKQTGLSKQEEDDKTEQELEVLLKRYKLAGTYEYNARNLRAKFLRKRKLISKSSRCSDIGGEVATETKIARIICKSLSRKQISFQQRMLIATTLMTSFLANKEKGGEGLHRALFQWIRCSESDTIVQNYKSWPIQAKCEHVTDCY